MLLFYWILKLFGIGLEHTLSFDVYTITISKLFELKSLYLHWLELVIYSYSNKKVEAHFSPDDSFVGKSLGL